MKKKLCLALLLVITAYGQSPIDAYLPDNDLNFSGLPSETDEAQRLRTITRLLPISRSAGFIDYVKAKYSKEVTAADFSSLLQQVEALRMNKIVGASSGVSGTTSLVSRVAAPAVLGVGVEYGGILQQNNGTVTTLRANLLGVSRLAIGAQQFPYCPVIDEANCRPASRWLRRVSGSLSFERVDALSGDTTTVLPSGSTTPTVAQLFSSDSRMASWGLHFDLTGTNNLDDPKYVTAWHQQIQKLRTSPEATALLDSITELFQQYIQARPDGSPGPYDLWSEKAVNALRFLASKPQSDRPTFKADFKRELERQLDDLIKQLSDLDPRFQADIANLDRAYNNYFQVRDNLIQEAQTRKFTLEYSNQHPRNQPFFSNVRLIFSHQPSSSQTIITLNAGLTWYHQTPAGTDIGKLRDMQVAGQLDRRLGQIPKFGFAVLTLAGYFQYLQDDTVVLLGPGNSIPGTGIIAPGTAATVLGTKGAIGVVQAKLSIPVGGTMKIPFSVTWSNRTELVMEKDIRAQVGLTLDFDSLFH